nr:MAG: RNA-dependent RNA polymerase [Drosophila Sighthill phlebovirus]
MDFNLEATLGRIVENNPSESVSGVLIPPSKVYRCGQLPAIPDLDVSRLDEDEFSLSFLGNVPEMGTIGSTIENMVFDTNFAIKFAHEFTMYHYGVQTDQKLKEHFPFFNQTRQQCLENEMTPDIIRVLDDNTIVLELGTFRIDIVQALRKSYNKKIEKYHGPLLDRTQNIKCYLTAIIVSTSTIISNVPLSDEEVNEMCFRYRVGLSVMNKLKAYVDLLSPEDTELSEQLKTIREEFESISFNWKVSNSFQPNSSEMYDRSITNCDIKYVAELRKFAESKAIENFTKKNFIGKFPCYQDRRIANEKECEKAVSDLRENRILLETRSPGDVKTIIQLPAIIPQSEYEPSSNIVEDVVSAFPYCGFNDDTTHIIWREVTDEIGKNSPQEMKYYFENVEAEMDIALQDSSEIDSDHLNKEKLKYRRVATKIGKEDQMALIGTGLYDKKFKNEEDFKYKKITSKLGLHPDSNTSDIDNFLNNNEMIFQPADQFSSYDDDTADLITDSLMLTNSHQENEWNEFNKVWLESRFGQYSSFITNLAQELTISLKQPTKFNCFVVKKLRNWKAYVLIKSSGSNNPLKFSLMFFKKDNHQIFDRSRIFKTLFENDYCYWTEFTTVNSSKLLNWFRTEPIMMSMLAYWHEFYHLQFWNESVLSEGIPSLLTEQRQAKIMSKLSLLIHLEDKAKTEQTITTSRFSIMEGFVADPCLPKPHKIFDKLPTVLRSRLQLWIERKLIASCLRIVTEGGFKLGQLNENQSEMHWEGLFNIFTGEFLSTPSQLISLMYLGYLKNKNETAEKNSGLSLITKILKYEEKMPASNEKLGLEDPKLEEINFHEFSPSYLKYCCAQASLKLRRNYGEDWKIMLENDILMAIKRHDLESIASLKATSNFNEDLYTANLDQIKRYKRSKVIEATTRVFKDDKIHLHEVMYKCLEKVESNGAMHICLFKKPQHGDLREIYVLGFEERIVQLTIETIARVICSKFPSETMTNPENKMVLPEQHHIRSKAAYKSGFVTMSTSDDAMKWNQGHYVIKFAIMLTQFTPVYMHPFIWRACSLFHRKRILLDPALISLVMTSESQLKSRDGYLQKIQGRYWGSKEYDSINWMKPSQTFIETKTGMMQGILHYTSSLLQTIFQEQMSDEIQHKFRWNLRKGGETHNASLTTIMQSSDDSSISISFPVETALDLKNGRTLSAICFEHKKVIGEYLGIYASVKCTSNTLWLMEFNSEFFFQRSVVRPLLRWVTAVCTLSEQETLAGRQEEMSSNLTSVLSGGGSFSLTALCQISQARLHYLSLGSCVNSLFKIYSRELIKIKDPSLGYFLLSNPYMAGLTNFRYDLWNCLKSTDLGKIYKVKLLTLEGDDQEFDQPNITKSGALVRSTIISFGDMKRWRDLRNKLDFPEDYEEQLDENPIILYTRSSSLHESRLKLACMFNSPGVMSSISRSNVTSKIIAAGAFIVSRPVVMSHFENIKRENSTKHSLLKLTINSAKELSDLTEDLTFNDFNLLFPFHSDYNQLNKMQSIYTQIRGAKKPFSHKRVNTVIRLTESDMDPAFRPENLVKYSWFQIGSSGLSKTVASRKWEDLKEVIPWLRDSPSESLRISPFNHQSQLRNFLARLDCKRREIKISGAPIIKTHGFSDILESVKSHFHPGFTLSPNFLDGEAVDTTSTNEIMHVLHLITASFMTQEKKITEIQNVLSLSKKVDFRPDFRQSRKNKLSVLQKVCRMLKNDKRMDKAEIVKKILSDLILMRAGNFGCLSKHFTSYVIDAEGRHLFYGEAIWHGMVETTKVELRLYKSKSFEARNQIKVSDVIVSDLSNIRFVIRFLQELIRSSGWCFESTNIEKPKQVNLMNPVGFIDSGLEKITRKKTGSRLYYRSNLSCPFNLDSVLDLRLTIKNNTIALVAEMGLNQNPKKSVYIAPHNRGRDLENDRMKVPIIKLITKNRDVKQSLFATYNPDVPIRISSLEDYFVPPMEPSSSWIKGQSLNSLSVPILVKAIMKEISIQEEAMKNKSQLDSNDSLSWRSSPKENTTQSSNEPKLAQPSQMSQSLDVKSLTQVLRNCFLESLKSQGVFYNKLAVAVVETAKENLDTFEYGDEMFNIGETPFAEGMDWNVMMDQEQEAKECDSEIPETDWTNEWTLSAEETVACLEMLESEGRSSDPTFLNRHPLLLTYTESIISKSSSSTLTKALSEKFIPNSLEADKEVICFMMNWDPTKIELRHPTNFSAFRSKEGDQFNEDQIG